MNTKNKYTILLISAIFALLSFGCEDMEPDSPPVKSIDESTILTISDLREICPSGWRYTFVGDSIVFGVVTMDETSGNIYKKLYIQDDEQAVELRLSASSRVLEGDSLRVNLKGTTLGYFNKQFQVDGLDVTSVVFRGSGYHMEPVTVTIPELLDASFPTEYQSKLVKIENVQFKSTELSKTYANAIDQKDESRTLEDSEGNVIIVRTSGYASFAGTTVAQGSGSIIAIATQYGATRQLVIRKLSEVELDGERF